MSADDLFRKRLRWRARRGMLEMDLVLTRFMDRHLEHLTHDELETFAELLELPDNDLMDFVNQRQVPSQPKQVALVNKWITI